MVWLTNILQAPAVSPVSHQHSSPANGLTIGKLSVLSVPVPKTTSSVSRRSLTSSAAVTAVITLSRSCYDEIMPLRTRSIA